MERTKKFLNIFFKLIKDLNLKPIENLIKISISNGSCMILIKKF